jgi:hypothetical protein
MLKQVVYTVTTDHCHVWNKRKQSLYNTMTEPIQPVMLLQKGTDYVALVPHDNVLTNVKDEFKPQTKETCG